MKLKKLKNTKQKRKMSEASNTFVIESIEAVIVGIGLIGNLLTIIIFSKKAFRSNSISTYCIALSIVQCITLTQFIADIHWNPKIFRVSGIYLGICTRNPTRTRKPEKIGYPNPNPNPKNPKKPGFRTRKNRVQVFFFSI